VRQQHLSDAQLGNPAESYERYFVPALADPLARDLIEVAALRSGERVLDVACGTGVVARLASEQVGSAGTVEGLDPNPAMLAVARSTTPPGTTIEWHQASAESMPLPEASFDAVLCQIGLQFVPDKHAAVREMRRVLVPGGRLIFSVPGPTPPLFEVLEGALAQHVAGEAAAFVRLVFSLDDPAEARELLADAGLRDVSVQVDTKSLRLPPAKEFLWQYVQSTPLADALAQANDEARAALERDVVAGWESFTNEDVLRLQVRMLVARGSK
jgi:ubiquinone/menaquinone biosynthesis C-methylase UbiE